MLRYLFFIVAAQFLLACSGPEVKWVDDPLPGWLDAGLDMPEPQSVIPYRDTDYFDLVLSSSLGSGAYDVVSVVSGDAIKLRNGWASRIENWINYVTNNMEFYDKTPSILVCSHTVGLDTDLLVGLDHMVTHESFFDEAIQYQTFDATKGYLVAVIFSNSHDRYTKAHEIKFIK